MCRMTCRARSEPQWRTRGTATRSIAAVDPAQVAGAAQMACKLFGPLEGGVHGVSPRCRKMIEMTWRHPKSDAKCNKK